MPRPSPPRASAPSAGVTRTRGEDEHVLLARTAAARAALFAP